MQLSYSLEMNPALAGNLFDISFNRIDAFAVEDDYIFPGMGVVAGTNPERQVRGVSTNTSTIKGIALMQSKEQNEDGVVMYEHGDTVPVLNVGRAWVPIVGEVTADSQAFLINSGANRGRWSGTSGGGASAIEGARFFLARNDVGLAVVELK